MRRTLRRTLQRSPQLAVAASLTSRAPSLRSHARALCQYSETPLHAIAMLYFSLASIPHFSLSPGNRPTLNMRRKWRLQVKDRCMRCTKSAGFWGAVWGYMDLDHYHWSMMHCHWLEIGAKNQSLVRLILGHSANRLLFMDLKDLKDFDGFKCVVCGRRMRLLITYFRLFFSLFLYAAACLSLIRHIAINTALSLSRCHYLAMRVWHFLFFVSICYGSAESCQDKASAASAYIDIRPADI